MGELVDGKWQRTALVKTDAQGRFRRSPGGLRGWVRADGGPGKDGRSFAVQAGRYHLVVALACPWAHRTSLVRALCGLGESITMDVVEPLMGEDGWGFAAPDEAPTPGSTHERILGARQLHELYSHGHPHYDGRVTTPLLWDKQTGCAVSNESADIMRMLATDFAPLHTRAATLVPAHDLAGLEDRNARVQRGVNEAVYRCGFAKTQKAYDEAIDRLFAELDALEAELSGRRYLHGSVPCEVDWRLFTTLVRFDWVYVTHFKCNLRRLVDYPALSGYLRELYQWPHVADTVHERQTKTHYFASHRHLNPSGIVPRGPLTDFTSPHGRNHLR